MKLIDYLHLAENKIEDDVKKAEAWIASKTPEAISAFQLAARITTEFVKAATSPEGIAIEAIIASVVPQAQAWTPVVIELATKLGTAATKVADDLSAVKGISFNYGGQIIAAIDGNKDTLDNYLLEFQKLFVK